MHNTSEQFYKYISQTIVSYLTERSCEGGERFNLYIEQDEAVKELYNSIKQEFQGKINDFQYRHQKGKASFQSYTVDIADSQLIVVASGEDVREDFITTLRNKVAKQEGVFERKNLLILFSGRLDSLLGGSESFLKEGMPLNGIAFRHNLENTIIESNNLKTHEKAILNYQLTKMNEYSNIDTHSIFDYVGIVSAIYQGTIADKDYPAIGLFPHQELSTISEPKALYNNIKENNERFEQIEYVFKHGDSNSDLDSLLSEKGIKELNSPETIWSEVDYSKISKWIEERAKTEPIRFVGDPPYESSLDVAYVFGRADGYTTTQKRRTNIILFNPMGIYPISLSFKFSKRVTKDAIKTEKNESGLDISTFGSRINLDITELETNYRWLEYYDNESKKKFAFKILILNCTPQYLESIKREFTIDKSTHSIELKHGEHPLIFNKGVQGTNSLTLEEGQTYSLEEDTALTLKIHDDYETDKTSFNLQIKEEKIPFSLITEKPPLQPITGLKVWKEKRERNKNYQLEVTENEGRNDTLKLINDSEEFTVSGEFRKRLEWEKQLIESDAMSWEIDLNDKLIDIELEAIPNELRDAYIKLVKAYRVQNKLPSLTSLKGNFLELSNELVQTYLKFSTKLEDKKTLTNLGNSLARFGFVCETHNHQDIYISPLHPLMLVYQITLNQEVGDEELYDAILTKLNPINLLPYFRWKGNAIYSPTEDSSAPEWVKYNNKKSFKKGLSKEFIRKLVNDKIFEFQKHFTYLFTKSQAPIIINVFNLGDCKEVLQGLFDFYEKKLKKTKNINELPCIDVNIYGSDKWVTKFEELTFYQNAKELEDKDRELKLRLSTTSNYDKDDLLNAFRRNVHFYTKPKEDTVYAHISFFHFNQEEIGYSGNIMEDIPTGISLGGLFSDLTSEYSNESYRTGFSTKGLQKEKNLLVQTSIVCNALGRVSYSDDLYEKDKSLCSTINFGVRESLEKIYQKSQWVTFIEPKVGLNFFKENEKVIIIHYSDQYNNTSGYDAITVTKKTEQYQYILREFLRSKKIEPDTENTTSIINLFNSINGDWLLKIIAQNNLKFKNEKLSLLSAVKVALVLYRHTNIVWIPTSLEEVLRISGNAGLKQSDSIFSAKNLGKSGSHSDDILLLGLEKVEDKLKMYLYPIEVKIGQNKANVIKKAKSQVQNTAELLKEAFNTKGTKLFKTALYKNFFAKLALVTAEKLKLYQIWESQEHQWTKVLEAYRNELLNNEFEVGHLDDYIGKGAIFLFGGTFKRKIEKENELLICHFLESDGYQFLCNEIDFWYKELIEKQSSINKSMLLQSTYQNAIPVVNSSDPKPKANNQNKEIKVTPVEKKIKKADSVRPIEILFGHDINTRQEVKWHPSTTSKVLHTNTGIIGTMGTGKTQFTKSLVTQLVRETKNNVDGQPIGILIFDYKGDYVKEDFVEATNAKVYTLDALPYNPLALDVHENALSKLPLHTASSIKETISTAYGLGNKQQQALREAIMNAYEEKGIDKNDRSTWSRIAPTIADACEGFLENENVSQDSLYAALNTLHEFEIFEPDATKTQSLFDLLSDGVMVINLSGYDESVQNLVVAITLDLFYTQMQKAGHSKIEGDYRQLNKMILVDEADNFLSKNFKSIRKILKEGREFGVGTILSTQFLSHFSTSDNDYSTYILTWIVHRVNEIRSKEVNSLFKLENKHAVQQLMNEIKDLEKHYSVVNLAGSEPIFIKDKAFWELIST